MEINKYIFLIHSNSNRKIFKNILKTFFPNNQESQKKIRKKTIFIFFICSNLRIIET